MFAGDRAEGVALTYRPRWPSRFSSLQNDPASFKTLRASLAHVPDVAGRVPAIAPFPGPRTRVSAKGKEDLFGFGDYDEPTIP